jgi:LacI family transcriptional regulator
VPPKSRSTQTDVARRAGVSQAMVSYVVNGNATVKIPDETRQRILEAMTELGYVPNALARGLRSGQTKTIGLVIPDNANPFFAEIARVIENIGFKNGFSVILCNSDYDLAKENAHVDVLLAKQVDGVIFCSSGGTSEAQQKLQDGNTPWVTIDHDISGLQTGSVLIDYQLGGTLATQHLLALGHQRIGCITGPTQFSSSSERLDGYRHALKKAGLKVDPALIVPGDFRIRGGESAMLALLKLKRPPTAVFAFNDLMAIGAMQGARIRGLQVPGDLSIVGFDDIPLAQALYPTLTTVAQPINEIARFVMEILLGQVQGTPGELAATSDNRVVLKPTLVVRDSTRPLNTSNGRAHRRP